MLSLGSIAILIGFAIVNLPEPKIFTWEKIKGTFSRTEEGGNELANENA